MSYLNPPPPLETRTNNEDDGGDDGDDNNHRATKKRKGLDVFEIDGNNVFPSDIVKKRPPISDSDLEKQVNQGRDISGGGDIVDSSLRNIVDSSLRLTTNDNEDETTKRSRKEPSTSLCLYLAGRTLHGGWDLNFSIL
jgi:hypothetical protein